MLTSKTKVIISWPGQLQEKMENERSFIKNISPNYIYIHEYDFPFTFHAPVRLLYYKSCDLSHDIPLFLFNLKTGLIFLTCSISNRKILKAPSAATIAQLTMDYNLGLTNVFTGGGKLENPEKNP